MTVRARVRSDAPAGKAGQTKHSTRSGPVPEDLGALAVLDDFPVLVWRSGSDARCNYFNKAWLAFTGRTMEQELGDGWSQGVHPDDREPCIREYLEAFRARLPFILEYRLRHHDGEYRWIRDIGRPRFGFNGEFSGYVGGCFDLTEHKHVEHALRQSEQQLRKALHARERLMQDLHDNTVQAIYAVGMGLEECQQLINENPAKAAALLQHAIDSLNGAIRGLRGYISGQKPRSPGGVRLRAELVRLARDFGRTGPLRFRVKVDPAMVAQVTTREAEQILSIAREAMSNAVRHSHARHGALTLCRTTEGVRLDVTDDGAGFEMSALRNTGSGLSNIALRAREIGARVELVSAPGHGTRVMLTLPERPGSHGPS